jgi:hypothetical protein
VTTSPWAAGTDAGHAPRAGVGWRAGILVGTAILAVAKACSSPPIPQDPHYFDLVDVRNLAGVRNALNVVSNAGFAVVGVRGIASLWRGRIAFRDARERWPWAVFFAGVTTGRPAPESPTRAGAGDPSGASKDVRAGSRLD